MNVTQVALRPTEASNQARRPSLTPELLAASGARYSRSNDGLQAILSKIDPENLDKSVDSIFKMLDYGHQSIADMVPVALFMDGISMWLAYYVWTLTPTAGGQESSTRYIKITPESLVSPEVLGIPQALRADWQATTARAFEAYAQALEFWGNLAADNPEVARIPRALRDDNSDKAQKAVARMKRNYGFDRARVFLPLAAATNMMLVMSARGWVQLCQHLLSHPNLEARLLGEKVRDELALAAPRMLRHAQAKDSFICGLRREFEALQHAAQTDAAPHLQPDAATFEKPPRARLEVMPPIGATGQNFAADLQDHDNRYAYIGPHLQRTSIRFAWDAVALSEIRDLNRHRTGTKWCPLVPVGFYSCRDQLPGTTVLPRELEEAGRVASSQARAHLATGEATYVYWTLLGTQFPFEHTTTANKFLYEAELRTGTGAHFRYAQHLHDALQLWFDQFPETRGLVLEGSAEPE